MSAGDFLRRLVNALRAAEVRFMVTGSFASSFHGAPRTTHDIDIVVELTGTKLANLLELLPDDSYYVSPEAAREALLMRGQFNVIDFESGWKADLIVRKNRPFSHEELERMVPAELLGVEAFVASAEDVVLAKLEWAAMSDSDLQRRDIKSILDTQQDRLDIAYIDRWARELGIEKTWHALRPPPDEPR